jgi:hypothetical protein
MFGDIYSSKQFYPGIDVTNEFELKKHYNKDGSDYVNSFFVANSKPFPIAKEVPKNPLLKEMYKDPSPQPLAKAQPIIQQNFKVGSMNPIKVENPFIDITNGKNIETLHNKNPDIDRYKLNRTILRDFSMKQS